MFRGTGFAELAGRYVFGDFISGRIWSMALEGTGMTGLADLAASVGGANWSSFGEDANRALYVVDYGGRIFKLGTVAVRQLEPVAVSLAAVPEPASWALMIAGFGLTGAAMRRRRLRALAG